MAQRRMLDKKISLNEAIAGLPDANSKLFFTWSIAHSDDIGVLPRSARSLKARVMPMEETDVVEIEKTVQLCIEAGLYQEFSYQDERYLFFPKFYINQTLKKDRQPHLYMPIKLDEKPGKSWDAAIGTLARCLGTDVETLGTDMEPEVKRSEEKRSEVKKNGATPRFVKPTLLEVDEYCKERKNGIDPQAFIDFYESKGWKVGNQPMRDWKAAVRTWERRRSETGNRGPKSDKYTEL